MTNTFNEIPEAIAARIVWRLFNVESATIVVPTFEQFEAQLESGKHPIWNRAVAEIADAMREYAHRKREQELQKVLYEEELK